MYRNSVIAITLLATALASNVSAAERRQLGYTELMSDRPSITSPVANDLFMQQEGATKAKHDFSGTVRIPENLMQTQPPAIQPVEIGGKKTQLFPGVDIQFVSHGDFLLPVERDLIVPTGGNSFWQIQISPGRTWSETSDEGMSRASFPFFLTSIIENETYNGIATFLYDDDSASMLRYQIVQHLSPFMIQTPFVAAGQTEIGYEPAAIDRGQLVRDFTQELKTE